MKGDRIVVLVTIASPGLVSQANAIGWTQTRSYTLNAAACQGSHATHALREGESSRELKLFSIQAAGGENQEQLILNW